MKNSGYDQFFKNARKAATGGETTKPSRQFSTSNVHFELSEADIEKQLKLRMGMKTKPKKKKKSIPWKMVSVSFLGLLVTAYGVQNYEEVERYVKRIEISFLGSAFAEEAPAKPAAEKPAAAKLEGTEVAKADIPAEGKKSLSDEEIDHLSKLNARKKELDEREEELARAEQELQAQKEELDKRLKDLEDVRRGISSVLEEKVKGDDKKIDTLVQMYSDMKPPQAAKVFETMDEDLAVDILGRMKKKNAADIMNLLKPEKAQVLSEKFAGYKRK
ncbi:MotE family protein [Bdellovibrio sp. HCB337]|uniref:MotE family protein n=1 Tax=Bdellovibrio sp. HCB337 TaxID=3394358 RepID=UPI0039A5CCAA